MDLRIASYNLWWHKAYGEVADLGNDKNIDVVCLQECHLTDLNDPLGKLRLAGSHHYVHRLPIKHRKMKQALTASSLQGNVGMAFYYNPTRLSLLDVATSPLPLPWQERNGGRIMQLARFKLVSTEQEFVVANVHLSALLAPNRARRKQLQEVLERIGEYRETVPTIIAGDFNYPLGNSSLRKLMSTKEFRECGLHDFGPTHVSRLLKGKFDRIFISSDCAEQSYSILPFGASDHAPIMVTVNLD